MNDSLRQQLNQLKNAYDKTLLKEGEVGRSHKRFLSKLENYKTAARLPFSLTTSPFVLVPRAAGMLVRSFGMVAAVLVLSVGIGLAMVSLLPGLLPGDAFYGIKLASERAQVSLALSNEQKAQLELTFAGRRVEEMTQLTEAILPDREERLKTVVEQFRVNIENTQSNLRATGSTKITEVAKSVDRKATEFGETLGRTGTQVSPEIKEQVRSAQDATQEVAFNAVTVLLENQRAGNLSLVELKDRVEEKLYGLESNLQVVAHRLAVIPGDSYPEIEAVNGPTLGSLYQSLSQARETLETGKDFFARGGYEAALTNYRAGVRLLNHLEWGTELYEQTSKNRLNEVQTVKDSSLE